MDPHLVLKRYKLSVWLVGDTLRFPPPSGHRMLQFPISLSVLTDTSTAARDWQAQVREQKNGLGV